ncbi:uncharacterized protein LOC134425486 [Melospiza melodia melodia]
MPTHRGRRHGARAETPRAPRPTPLPTHAVPAVSRGSRSLRRSTIAVIHGLRARRGQGRCWGDAVALRTLVRWFCTALIKRSALDRGCSRVEPAPAARTGPGSAAGTAGAPGVPGPDTPGGPRAGGTIPGSPRLPAPGPEVPPRPAPFRPAPFRPAPPRSAPPRSAPPRSAPFRSQRKRHVRGAVRGRCRVAGAGAGLRVPVPCSVRVPVPCSVRVAMPGAVRTLCLAALLGALRAGGTELTLELPDSAQRCFHQELESGVKFTLDYQVISGGHYDVDCYVEDPNGKTIYQETKKQYDSFSHHTEAKGVYTFCFSNEFSTFSHKIVYFDFQVGDEPPILPDMNNRVTALTQLESACVTIHEMLKAVIDSQTHYRLREAQDRSRAEELNGRVSYWSVGETLILFVVSIGQVVLLKSFFTEKRPSSGGAGT